MKKENQYIPQLDGVRAIAIGLVLFFHWMPSDNILSKIPMGPIGVTLFFVLSGYLITNILEKDKDESNKWGVYKVFLIRRALRIFPIYFLVLLIITVLNRFHIIIQTDFYEHPLYYWFYAYNFLLEITHFWGDYLSPYWSLSVEEQFYMLWGVLILFLKQKKSFFWSIMVLGILFRYYFIIKNEGIGVNTLTCIDTFTCGALWAIYQNDVQKKWFEKLLNILTIILSIVLLYIFFKWHDDNDIIKILFFRTSVAFLSLKLIVFAIQSRGVFYKILISKPLQITGKISYGLYLYHMVVPALLGILLAKLHINISSGVFSILSLVCLFLVSYISWRLIELPINNLKNRFFQPKGASCSSMKE